MKKKNKRDLIKNLERANAGCDVSKQIDASYELAEAYRKDDDLVNAIQSFENTFHLAKQNRDKQHWSLSARALAEIYANRNDLPQASHYAEVYRSVAAEFRWASEIQLSYHVTAYVHQVVWSLSGIKSLLEKSYEWAQKSYKYLLENGKIIDGNKEDVLRAGPTIVRLSTVSLLLAQILSKLGKQQSAVQYAEKALKAAKKSGDSNVIISTFQAYYDDYATANKLEIAKDMMNEANKLKTKKEKCIASLYLLKAYLYHCQELPKAREECYGIVAHHWQELDEDERKTVRQTAVTLWRLVKAEKEISNWEILSRSSGNKSILKTRYEKLGDFATESRLYSLALRYYRKFEAYAEISQDKATALEAVVTTFLDCLKKCKHLPQNPSEGLAFVEKLISLQERCGKDTDASRELRFELLLFTGIQIEKARDELKKLSGICEKELESAQAAFSCFANGIDDEEADDEELEIDRCDCKRCPLDFPNDQKVFALFQEEAKLFFKRNHKDKEGETELHKAARDGDVDKVRLMVTELGFNVNETDNGFWTPLHEATNVPIAEILLDNGAKVDPKSKVSLICDGENDSGGGCTPLMSACYYANLDLAELLLSRGASVTAKNDRGYTAVDFLKLAITNGSVSDECIEPARIFAEKMENQQLKAGMEPRKEELIRLGKGVPRRKPLQNSTLFQTQSTLGPSQSQCFEEEIPIRATKRSSGGNIFVIPDVICDDNEEQENRYSKRPSTSSRMNDLLYNDEENSNDEFNINTRKRPKRSKTFEKDDDLPFIDDSFPTDSRLYEPPSQDPSQVFGTQFDAPSTSHPNFGFNASADVPMARTKDLPPPTPPANSSPNYASQTVPGPSRTRQIRIKITYQNADGSPFLNNDGQPQSSHLIMVNRADRFATLSSHSKCLEVLSGRPHLWFFDGCDVDKEITIGDLAPEDGLFSIVCQISQISVDGEYRRIAEISLIDVAQALSTLTITSELDASEIILRKNTLTEMNAALGTIRGSTPKLIKMRFAELGKLSPTSSCFSSWANRFTNTTVLSMTACGLTNEHVNALTKTDGTFSIQDLDISYNIFSDGQILSSFLSRLGQLKELDLRGTNITRFLETLSNTLSNIHTLECLELSHNDWITTEIFQQIFEGCSSLTSLRCENVPIDVVSLDVASGTNMRRLSLSFCPITSSGINQLIEWIQFSQVEEVDLSGVTLTLENFAELLQSRRGKAFPLRVMCEIDNALPEAEQIYDLFYMKYRENDDVRFRFSESINRKMQDYGSCAERFFF
ncbi:unnamed protein product, partial [Mesorhabditis belari]|uniref:Tonsoku-like protein n=1 Tax=Mesorhabditis belari TaxID=2138241 RepID=A0AAF3FE58_9BILA